MQRRTLLKLSATGGLLSLATPWFLPRARAAEAGDKFWIFVTAGGGWDPRFMFDPSTSKEQNRITQEIGHVGNIPFSPIDALPEEFGFEMDAERTYLNPERFLGRFGSRMTVFNGVDTSTNNHDAGARAVTTGSIQEDVPAMGALLAAAYGQKLPLPFMSFGGYDATFDLAPLSRIGSGGQVRRVAAPNEQNPDDDNTQLYHTADTWQRIRAAQTDRIAELVAAQKLPKLNHSILGLQEARATDGQLAALKVPELVQLPGNMNDAQNLIRAGQLALSAFSTGLGVAASLSMGGFDTHGNHDQQQRRQVIQLLTGIGGLLDQIDAQGLSDRTYVMIGSDFGRTPSYNQEGDGGGKDHWPITSFLAIGPGIQGDRVIGATTKDQNAQMLDPKSLAAGSDGVKLTPSQIHVALRRLAGFDDALTAQYPLLSDDLPLFS
ncbi:MAG TPA: DUF1501 domain-containing protein [Polyangiaceae bacterium]|jgi:uncharacterized protein (DUF1501 family)|nr:DUF1501 domain-containing protein [Polyangiaceae bacterium]